MTTPQEPEELTPRELRLLIQSNARAIEANSASNQANSEAIAALTQTMGRLAETMSEFLNRQSRINRIVDDSLEDHEERISRMEGGNDDNPN